MEAELEVFFLSGEKPAYRGLVNDSYLADQSRHRRPISLNITP